MVFPSLPLYLDPPNWQQPPIQQQGGEGGGGGCESNTHHHLPPPLPPGGTGSIRPGSMTDKARLAKIPQPEAALKCPRCESTNTKFCYFNNYSLTQPRHFCKTCRRYWTRGGALRNIPVGGGCRRNKRSSGGKGSRSKSPAPTGQGGGGGSNSSSTSSVLPSTSSDMISHFPNFLNHLNHQHLTEYASSGDMGLSFGGIQAPNGPPVEFHGGFGAEQWRLQQFPFLNGLEAPTVGNMYPFETAKALNTAMGAVKVENINNNNQQNMSRNFLGISGGHDQNQYWIGGGGNANAWTDLAGFNNSSSSTRHLL